MLRTALPALIAVLSLPAAARAQPGDEPVAPPPAAPEASMCQRGDCGPPREARFAVGIAGGYLEVDDGGEGRQHSLLGRIAIGAGFAVELELTRADLDEGGDARTAGVGLEKFLVRYRRIQPYLAVGTGGGVIELANGSESHQGYAELGGGLLLRGRRLALGLDARAGVRRSEAPDEAGVVAAMSAPAEDSSWRRDHYRRARLVLLVQF
jgi:hypothetical protein